MLRNRKRSRVQPSAVQVVTSRGRVHVWYCENGQHLALAGTVANEVATDASRYGQDLVGELVDQALRIAERRRMEVGGP
jgi:hypothetical protein